MTRRYNPRLLRLSVVGIGEGDQELDYFKRLKTLINSEPDRAVDVDFKLRPSNGGDPEVVVRRAQRLDRLNDQPKMAVFDFDGKTNSYCKAIDLCATDNIWAAHSNYSLDLWLILHKVEYSGSVNSCADYTRKIREIYNLSCANIKCERCRASIMSQIDLSNVKDAIARAKRIEMNNGDVRRPFYTPKGNHYYSNPHLGIHSIVEKILNKAEL